MTQPKPLSADRPLEDPLYDRLGYAAFSKQLAVSILKGSPSDGLVVALYGDWGTGKTSALKFIVHYLKLPDDAPVISNRITPYERCCSTVRTRGLRDSPMALSDRD